MVKVVIITKHKEQKLQQFISEQKYYAEQTHFLKHGKAILVDQVYKGILDILGCNKRRKPKC